MWTWRLKVKSKGPERGGGDALGAMASRAILHVKPTHTIRALVFDTEGIVIRLLTGVAKVFGGVEGLVKEKRNSSSEERWGERRSGMAGEKPFMNGRFVWAHCTR
jgi:hypothetical protein